MITENEMRIANTSYINKDFAQIYPELLDIFKSLTSKYDPTTSNESDPGVVLLKLLGFIGDKLNYNVDKNVLECFAPSATQESSMRRILSPLGYEMGYYHGATTEVQFIFKGTDLDSASTAKSFTFYKYKTILTDNDESVQFVLMENCTISAKNTAFKANAIQGRVEQLTSGDSETILLESIDSNNRIYFPVGQVAENGVWVRKVDDETEWERVDNLNSQTPKQLVYRFGYDSSRGLPYIEFPSDLASIIGNGLLIDYVVCDGANGNISANTLTTLSSPTSGIAISGSSDTLSFSEESGNDLLIIKNLSASVDGADPETIDEAYSSFKKTIGTFDTLVTCRDYANAIYNMEDAETGSAIVSNCQVTDRRDDLMRSTRVVSFDEYGQYETNVKNGNNKDVDANDIFLYPLSPMRAYTKAGYVESFQPLQSTRYIENALESQKLASHDYNNPKGLYCIKNKLGIKANISTTSKVNSYERLAIITNVTSALIRKFNAREVDYGQEIPYDSILETIEGADERISSVSLAEPSLTTYVMGDDGDETALISSNGLDFLLTILARNILAGKASLFDYDDDFSYEFGQKSINDKHSKLGSLSKISSETNIKLSSGTKATILKNEVVQLMAPSLVTSIQYVAYTYYNMSGLSSSSSVQANTNYRLKEGEKLTITYTDSSTSQEVTRVYGAGQIIKPNFELSNTIGKKYDNGKERKSGEYTSGVVEKKVTIDGKVISMWFVALKANETIDIEQLNSKTFNAPTYFYWIRNNSKNKLFPEGAKSSNTYETVLGDNEYLFYTDDGFSNLATLGSGTTVKCVGMDASGWEAPTISYEEVYESGLLSLQDKWQYKTLSESATMTVQENCILTLVAGDDITWTADPSDASKSPMLLGNGFQDINGSISYTSDGTSGTWEGYGIDGVSTRIRSRLDIDAGPSLAQSIVDDRQSIKFIPIKEDESGDDDEKAVTLDTVGQEFNLSTQLQFAGSGSMDVSSLDLVTNKTKYPVSAYFHVQQTDGDSKKTVSRNADGYLTYTIKYGVETDDGKPFSYDIPALEETKVLMLYASIKDGYQLKVSSDVDQAYLRVFNKSDAESFASSITISKSGICNIEIAPDAGSLKIELEKTSTDSESSGGSATIILGKLRYIREDSDTKYGYALNPDLGISGEVAETLKGETRLSLKGKLLEMIRNLDNGGKLDLTKEEYKGLAPLFYYTCDIDNAKVIESDDLTSPEALYDSNNVANKMAISEIDLSALDVDVVRSSRL